ncbi:MAG: hypothetical protein LZF60_10048 [Nitrospira sp.]|nr:MAG: hypothetical protein LZF60_10048 [Nitrospira sp.]
MPVACPCLRVALITSTQPNDFMVMDIASPRVNRIFYRTNT